MVLNGNVTDFTVSNNVVHDNNNIGIDFIGYEQGVCPDPAQNQARNGVCAGNTIYNITSVNNPAYGGDQSADGIYVDGGKDIVIEGNNVYLADIRIELASEGPNQVINGGPDPAGSELTSGVILRNNLIHDNYTVGLDIGGYDADRGGTDHCTIVNNTFYNNDTLQWGQGEFQIQYYATNNVFKNNILYANEDAVFVNNLYGAVLDIDYDLFYSTAGGTAIGTHSVFGDPLFTSLTVPTFTVSPASPAVNAGINLGADIVGTIDFAGNPRVQGSGIDMGAYEQ